MTSTILSLIIFFRDHIKWRDISLLGCVFYVFFYVISIYLKLFSLKLVFILLCSHLLMYFCTISLNKYFIKWAFIIIFLLSLLQFFSNVNIHSSYYSSYKSQLLWSMSFPSPEIILYKKLPQPIIKSQMYWLRIMLGNDYKGTARFTIVFNGIDFGLTKFWNENTSFMVSSEMYCEIPLFALSKSITNIIEIRQLIPDPSLRIRVIGSVIPSFFNPNAGIYDGFKWHDGVPSVLSGQYIVATPIIFLESVPEVYQ